IYLSLFVFLVPRLPTFPLFPYTTLFRSVIVGPVRRRPRGKRAPAHRSAWTRAMLRWPASPTRPRRAGASQQRDRARSHRPGRARSEEHTSELQSRFDVVCRLLLEKKTYT